VFVSKRLAVAAVIGFWCCGVSGWVRATDAEPVVGGQSFAEALRAAGWQVDVLADGTLQLTPGDKVPPATETTERAAPEASDPAPTTGPSGWSVLSAFGWRVEAQPNGDTLLFPPSVSSNPEPREPPAAEASTPTEPPDAQTEVVHDLDALLAERGWRVQRDEDGSLRLFPLLRARAVPAGLEPSQGYVPAAIRDGQVQLPVDSWEKARATVLSWLESVGDPSLEVGKIRQIHQVYVVSIIGNQPPKALAHQVAVGVDDGRVVVLR
jgi:pyruvate/2-oxoglutarate dehydrogenase complex dihydrolipoamide acyltransferase (E2) component